MSTYTTALHHVTVCRSADGRLHAYARCSEAGQLVRQVIHDRGQPDRHPGPPGVCRCLRHRWTEYGTDLIRGRHPINDQSEYANWREVVHGHPSVQTARQAYEHAPTARSWDEYVRSRLPGAT
jgi:hypothetical protein